MHLETTWRRSVARAPYTTLGIGGLAAYAAPVTSLEAMQATLQRCSELGLRFCILGKGSNVLCSDGFFDGVVVLNKIGGVEELSRSPV